MKVNDPNLSNVNAGALRGTGLDRAQQTEPIGRRGAGGTSSVGDAPDSVSLSGRSAELRAANVDSPERVGRLNQIASDVATGSYQVDAAAVSHSLVEAALRPRV